MPGMIAGRNGAAETPSRETASGQSNAEALNDLFWHSEILQAMYWMRGERIAEDVDASQLARFLAAHPAMIANQLERLVAAGFVVVADRSPRRFRLTERGSDEGARSFDDEFASMTRPGHGECGPGCWCQDPRRHADACSNRPEAARGA